MKVFEQVRMGNFSFIQEGVDEGRPRVQTPVGEDSFKMVTGLFYGVKPMHIGSSRFKVASKSTSKKTGNRSYRHEYRRALQAPLV